MPQFHVHVLHADVHRKDVSRSCNLSDNTSEPQTAPHPPTHRPHDRAQRARREAVDPRGGERVRPGYIGGLHTTRTGVTAGDPATSSRSRTVEIDERILVNSSVTPSTHCAVVSIYPKNVKPDRLLAHSGLT